MQDKEEPAVPDFGRRKDKRSAPTEFSNPPGSSRSKEGMWLFTALVLTAAVPVVILAAWMAWQDLERHLRVPILCIESSQKVASMVDSRATRTLDERVFA